jgi:hypothetical protein
MAHLIEKERIFRVNGALLLAIVGGGLVVCALGAVLYDISRWFGVL